MRERDRLRALEMRVSGEDGPLVLARAADERALEAGQGGGGAVARADDEEPLVERDLIVPAATGVQVARVLPDELPEAPLHVRVDVLQRGIEADLPARELVPDLIEGRDDAAGHRLRDDPLRRQHRDVRLAAPDVLGVQRAVILDRDGERDEPGIGVPGERRAGDGLRLLFRSHAERGR